MKRIIREQAVQYAFTKSVEPLLRVDQGEEFIVETQDAIGNRIRSEADLPTPEVLGELTSASPMKTNFLGGPIFVEGARKGDVLAVDVLDIIPVDQGVNFILPGFGPLSDSAKYHDCNGPFTRLIRHIRGPSGTTSDGKAVLTTGETWDLNPHIGTIGVAPEWETLGALISQGPWGGNLDCRDVCKGSTIYLPVHNEGALLYVGDVHGCMADGEFSGVADECAAEIRLRCTVIKNKTIPYVRIEKTNSIIQVCSYRPLEEAVRKAFLWMIDWLHEDYGKSQRDAYIHLSINPKVRINIYQMVMSDRLEFTVGVESPK